MPTIEVRDAVHGLITLREREWAVIDTPAFQRLRGVAQLAMTYLVYPGARHSRFEHCMGACHVAGRLATRINDASGEHVDDEQVRLAALVHDIGHGPFSHVSEEVFEALSGDHNVHEKISAAIVLNDPQVKKAVGADNARWIADLLTGRGHGLRRSVERDIVAGPADIDKLDYLLRDSRYCGVNYGSYDLAKLIEGAIGGSERGVPDSFLGFHEDAIHALEEMLLARYHMHRQVYGHKTRVGIDRMLVRAMILGVEEGLLDRDVFCPPEKKNKEFVQAYLQWNDAAVTRKLCNATDNSRAGQLMRALVERKLCKRVARLGFTQLQQSFGRLLAGNIAQPEDKVLDRLLPETEARLAQAAAVEPHWVMLHWEDRGSALSMRYSWRAAAKEIFIVDTEGETTAFHDRSEIFTRVERQTEPSVSLYLRTSDDKPLSKTKSAAIEKALLAGLEIIGSETAAV
ncbi:MAG: HD domain-containing protein [Acidimicrobiia bacterium]